MYRLTAGLHCKEDPIYVFLEMKLRGFVPDFYINVSVSDLYIPTLSPPILLQQNKQTYPGNIQIAHRYMNVGIGYDAALFISWNICFEFSVQCLLASGVHRASQLHCHTSIITLPVQYPPHLP
jgi:hypothetical protein